MAWLQLQLYFKKECTLMRTVGGAYQDIMHARTSRKMLPDPHLSPVPVLEVWVAQVVDHRHKLAPHVD